MIQLSNKIYCEEFLAQLEIETKILPNPYYDYPYMIIEDFLPSSLCEEITNFVKKDDDTIEAKIRVKDENLITRDLNKEIRKTKIHKLSSYYRALYQKSFLKHQKEIEDFFKLALTTSTKLQVLEYTKGSFYKAHSDDSNVLLQDEQIVGFLPVAPQRKITTVLFTTNYSDIDMSESKNHFSGGELLFNYLYDKDGKKVLLKPKAGDMVVFLSNPYFTHEVLEVKSGFRVSLVQWHDALV